MHLKLQLLRLNLQKKVLTRSNINALLFSHLDDINRFTCSMKINNIK